MEAAAQVLPIVAIAAIFWLLIIRPASRQRKEATQLQAALAVGDDVMLTSGIFGTIVDSADDELGVEVAPGVVIRVVRGAVASVRRELGADGTPVDPADTSATSDDEEDR